jgi:Acetyltransferase (GNAT) family
MVKRKPKASELQYHGSESHGKTNEREIVAAHEGRIVGYLSSSWQGPRTTKGTPRKGSPQSRGLNLAWVDPAYQRRGIASTMLGLERHRTGYTPIGDRVLSAKGQAFQRGTGVPTNPKGEVVALGPFGGDVSGPIQRQQQHMLAKDQFDPHLVKLVAPYKEPRRRRGPQPQQMMLPGTERF